MDGYREDADLALSDCAYLVMADPAEVIPLLGRAQSPRARLAAAVYRLSLTWHRDEAPEVRRQILSLDAARLGDGELARCFAEVSVAGAAWPEWTPRWATGNGAGQRRLLAIPAHEDGAGAVACTLLDGRPVAVTGGDDALVRVWDLTTGSAVGDSFAGHEAVVKAVACAELDGRPVIASLDAHGDVWVWDLVTREPVQAMSTRGFHSCLLLVPACLDGRLVVVTGSRRGAQVWDVATGERIGRPMAGHTGGDMEAMACTTLDGRIVLVTAGEQGLVWDLATSERIGELILPGYPRERTMTTVACTDLDGQPVAVAACAGGEVLLWDLAGHALIGAPLGGHTGGARDIACADLDGRRVALVGDWNGTVRVWDLAAGELLAQPVGRPSSGFDYVRALACAVVDGRPVVVTCGYEGWVRAWVVGAHEPAGQPVVGHTMDVHAVAPAEIGGRAVVMSGGSDHAEEDGDLWEEYARLWDLATGKPIGGPMIWLPTGDSREEDVAALTYLHLDGRDLAVAGIDRSVCLWDLGAGELVGSPMVHTTQPGRFSMDQVECTWVDGRPIAISLCNGDLRVWDLRSCEPFDAPAPGSGWVHGVACTVLNGRAVVVTSAWTRDNDLGEREDAVQVWDLATGEPIGTPMTGHTDTVHAVACAEVDGRPIAVTGSDDGTVRRWDLAAQRRLGTPMVGHGGEAVRLVACTELDGRPVAVSGGPDTVQAWDLRTGERFGPVLRFPCYVDNLTTTPRGQMLVTFGSDIAMLTRSPRAAAR
ncbi:WD40 repeat domain-containing protein [Nonomuraea sp. B19D2]|uniref:WD40 repeat domain-containing protein n=1 Tax=Nonomuraea sp. B19D2 TaxID=3159561 RepID=UPI0032D9BDCA